MNPWLIFRIAIVLALLAAFVPGRPRVVFGPGGDEPSPRGGCSMMHPEY
jgi:hypothetical protein